MNLSMKWISLQLKHVWYVPDASPDVSISIKVDTDEVSSIEADFKVLHEKISPRPQVIIRRGSKTEQYWLD